MKPLVLVVLAALLLGIPRPSPAQGVAGALPFVEQIEVRPKEICLLPGRTLCPSDSIRVAISGQFPGFCCARPPRIELLPSPIVGPEPEPPTVRIVVDYDIQVRCACSPDPQPYFLAATLPPLPPRGYGLRVELLQRGGGRDSTLDSTQVPFQVVSAESCGAGPLCLTSRWEHRGPYGSCDAYVSTDHPGSVTLMVNSQAALSGLQGSLHSLEQGLRVIGIEPIGVAAGMRLSWVPTFEGARFVLFADQGAPIPAGQPIPILAVRVLAEGIASIPEVTPPPGAPVFHLAAEELQGADEKGNGVPTCPPPPCVDLRMAYEVAVICREQACDFDADGLTDVRDIVLMVHCALEGSPCPPDVETHFDCDASGAFDVADVVCCAMNMLRAPGCPLCPPDSVRVEPGIAVHFGVPRRIGGGVEVPFSLEGFDRVGAARLHLRFPADRFTAQVVGFAPLFYLQQIEGDQLTVGLIGAMPVPVPLDDGGQALVDLGPLVVRLLLRPGRSPGGELRFEDGQMSGPDGILLGVNLEVPSVPLGDGSLEVSAARPNPFSSSTRFTVALDAPARLDVSIHDISGRRLARLFHGVHPAGLEEFTWTGRGDDGSEVPNGIYFIRVSVDGRSAQRKLVLIRGRGPAAP